MKIKTYILILVIILMLFSLTACNNKENSTIQNETEETEIYDNTTYEMLDINVEKRESDVEIVVPAEYVNGQTQEELDKIAEESGYKSITLNEDGSATYVMTKLQHSLLMGQIEKTVNEALQQIIDEKLYPNFTEIKVNDNCSEFTVFTSSTEVGEDEYFIISTFYIYGEMYEMFNGEKNDDIKVVFINSDTGEKIHEASHNEAYGIE